MAAHELAAALAAASETDKATLAQYVLHALERAGVPHDSAAKRLIVGAMDRYADEEGNV
ncbi:hypothetical protein [Paracoccus sanguinis]|uniref:Uncharacterized protein n=1 Tax=Paracoccus sanguinis TaxID=1545044 RepID=A0A1H2WLQ2_9RHOB|nr:hypothetical protein [Paracoccus sanguinis]QJD15966.1 hypothetical protein HGN31_02970 [Paracoccus sanguinis]SDW81428.1 hypothetical protein SAMN05444276_102196 [Paracoccus sanguinis]